MQDNLTDSKENTADEYDFSAEGVAKFLSKITVYEHAHMPVGMPSRLRLGIAQIHLRAYSSLSDYLREMIMIVRSAVDQGAHIVCLPAFSGLLPVTVSAQYENIKRRYDLTVQDGKPHDMWIYQSIAMASSGCHEVFTATMSGLSRLFKIYIMAGTSIYSEKSAFVHRAIMYGPTGKVIGMQDKLAKTKIEDIMQTNESALLSTFTTPLGKFAIVIGNDGDYFEITKAAFNQGVRVVFSPCAFLTPRNRADSARGLNLRVQETPMYAAQSTLIGKTPFGFELEGRAGVYAPYHLSLGSSKDSMFIKSIKENRTNVVLADLSIDALESKDHNYNSNFLINHVRYLY